MSDTPSILTQLKKHADQAPSRPAIITKDYRLSYGDLHNAVIQQARIFDREGINKETLVGIKCADEARHMIMCLASMYLGATTYTVPSYEKGMDQSDLAQYFPSIVEINTEIALDPQHIGNYKRPIPLLESDANILFPTSGTTGKSKLVIHSGKNMVAQAHRHIHSYEERFACLASIEHNFSKRHRLYCFSQGATNVFINTENSSVVEQCKSLEVNVLHVSAYQAQELLSYKDIEHLGNIKLKLGGSHVSSSLRKQLKEKVTPNLYAGYGTTETGAIAFSNPSDKSSIETVGLPLDGIDVRIMNPEKQTDSDYEQGELAIRCKGMFLGYLGKDDLYHERVVDDWFYTGDIGYLDSHDRIHLSGRADDAFLFNSINIYPQELESDIRGFNEIEDVSIIPKPSTIHGDIPVAIIVPRDVSSFSLSKLRKYMQAKAGIRCPRQYIIAESIPRNQAGKVIRQEVFSLSDNIDELRTIFCDELESIPAFNNIFSERLDDFKSGLEDIDLRLLDMDSLMRMELLVFIETRFDTIIPIQELYGYRYLSEIITRISSNIHGQPDNGADQPHNKVIIPTFGSSRDTESDPELIRRFQRIFNCCDSVTKLNRVLRIYEDHLTPPELSALLHTHANGKLIRQDTKKKLVLALNEWLLYIEKILLTSDKNEPEPYSRIKLKPAVWLFSGKGKPEEKTLIVCFALQGLRRITIPNTLLMQYADASQYDILMVGEPCSQGYMQGVPLVGKDEVEVIHWIKAHGMLSHYQYIRTIGASAGAYPAILAGYYLNAELTLSVGGRFHSTRKYPGLVWRRIKTVFVARFSSKSNKLVLSYSSDSRRDTKFARIISLITGGKRMPITDDTDVVDHQFFSTLLKKEKLKGFFQQTIFFTISNC